MILWLAIICLALSLACACSIRWAAAQEACMAMPLASCMVSIAAMVFGVAGLVLLGVYLAGN